MTFYPPFQMLSYVAEHARDARHFMSSAIVEPMSLQELLSLAGKEDLRHWSDFPLSYSKTQGADALRSSIAGLYPGLEADDIMVFSGAQEAIFCCYHALLDSADHVAGISPYFEPLLSLPGSLGAEVTETRLTKQEHGWHLNIEAFINSINEKTCLAVINFPHNPTGLQIKAESLQQIVQKCEQQDCWLFSDEVFRGLEYHDEDRLTPAACLSDKAISLGSMAKAYGLGGIRIGWLATKDVKLRKRMMEIRNHLSVCNSRADEQLTQIALSNGPTLLERNRNLIQKNLEFMEQQRDQLAAHIDWLPPEAGCLAFPALHQHENSKKLAKTLLQKSAVLMVPGMYFSTEDQQFYTHFRVGLGLKSFPDALTKLLDFYSS